MILIFDVGNSNIKIALAKDCSTIFKTFRINTDYKKTPDEYYVLLSKLFDTSKIRYITISSVVPKMTTILKIMSKKLFNITPFMISDYNNIKLDLNITTEEVNLIGSDIISACKGIDNSNANLIIDLGTAIKYIYINNNSLIGVVISPGVIVSMVALNSSTALLPEVEIIIPKNVLGTNTIECIQSGITYGTASQVDGLIDRIKMETKTDFNIIITGGLSKIIGPLLKHNVCMDPDLVLKGILKIHKLNK